MVEHPEADKDPQFTTAKKDRSMYDQLIMSGSAGMTANQVRQKQMSAEHQSITKQLDLLQSDGLDPIRLNFDAEQISEEPEQLHNSSLADFPSLKDLETSNLFSNRFHGEQAARTAFLALNETRK